MSKRSGNLTRTSLGVISALALLVAGVGLAAANTTPTFNPPGFNTNSTAYTHTFAGTTRFTTAGAQAIFNHINEDESGGAPFSEPNFTHRDFAWGNDDCPGGVAVVASDTPADSLSASAAQDTTITGPLVGGGTGDAALHSGSILLTAPNRNGSDPDLAPATIQALTAIRDWCGDFDAVIFGGTAAVGPKAADTLDSIAVDVVRVAGVDRFDTARRSGVQVGTSEVTHFPTAASDGVALGETVFLAEGFTGADALAVGPFAADMNVPVLLTQTNSLPIDTRNALIQLNPATIVVLGGTAAISDAVVAEAASAGSATALRVFGATRAGTSVEISKQLWDIWPEDAVGVPEAFDNELFGLARSEGSGASHLGWPDALSSSWTLANWIENAFTPERLAPDVESNPGDVTIGGTFNDFRAPLLLTGQGALPTVVSEYLAGLYPPAAGVFKTATNPGGVNDGGFGLVFGGPAAVSNAAVLQFAGLLSGGTYTSTDRTPTQNDGLVFFTRADFTGYTSDDQGGVDLGAPSGPYAGAAITAGRKACAFRNSHTGSQYLGAYNPSMATGSFLDAVQFDYQNTGTAFSALQSRFACVSLATAPTTGANAFQAAVLGVSLSGNRTQAKVLNFTEGLPATNQVQSTTSGGGDSQSSSGSLADPATNGGTSTQNINYVGLLASVTHKGTTYVSPTVNLNITITRTQVAAAHHRYEVTGTFEVRRSGAEGGTVIFSGTLTGEAAGGPFGAGAAPATLPLVGFYNASGPLGGFHFTVATTGEFAITDIHLDGNA